MRPAWRALGLPHTQPSMLHLSERALPHSVDQSYLPESCPCVVQPRPPRHPLLPCCAAGPSRRFCSGRSRPKPPRVPRSACQTRHHPAQHQCLELPAFGLCLANAYQQQVRQSVTLQRHPAGWGWAASCSTAHPTVAWRGTRPSGILRHKEIRSSSMQCCTHPCHGSSLTTASDCSKVTTPSLSTAQRVCQQARHAQ
jgi:hypothetical protein